MVPRRKEYRQIAKDILLQITGGEVTEEHTYAGGRTSYRLSNTPVESIAEVKGRSKGNEKVFAEGVDYRLSADSVEWLGGGEHPDEGAKVQVRYSFTKPGGLSDVNPGSVLRTVVEAVSREIEHMYAQMDQAYLSGFLDTATAEALDMVVALLGVKRKPPQPSSGHVTFGRNIEPEKATVSGEVHLYDGSPEYVLKKPLVKDVTKVEGTVGGSADVFDRRIDYDLVGRTIRWLPEGKKPDARTVFRVNYVSYQEVRVPKKAVVATFSPRAEETRSFSTSEDGLLRPVEEGRWEADVPVVCDQAGRWGNVLAGTITVMPQPVQGIEYVINKADITNGVEAETDEELRERARHALEFAGRATVSSLESAIRAIEGVRSLLVQDMPDGVEGVVQVIVDGGDPDQILRVIDETRGAGIKIEFSRPRVVYIDVSCVLTLPESAAPLPTTTEAERLIRTYVSSLGIGENVLFSRIIDAALAAREVLDVTGVVIKAHREKEVVESLKDNIKISSQERAEPRNITVSFEPRE